MQHFEKNRLVRDSDVIVYGTVLSQDVQKDFNGFPVTDTLIEVQKTYKGIPAETVKVRAAGGETDDMIYIVDEPAALTFAIGEKVVLFLGSDQGAMPETEDLLYYAVGQNQGKFKVGVRSDGMIENGPGTHSFDFNHFQNEIDELEN
ncbi:hypothetical protein QWJ34_14235 [Saccharibacillus sp. CPCC 101409]|uniref:hypothetical protein n=1 Tax=Saccharibacillus sp. CPCC 101409 TaxID=3058041 RepID=UPI0026717CEF|nr:hypothetical protein [Saccharibacillus sp. CPCC 101409]MDO3410926.1 hypothetical protein [Saccharibacillus sp. CPCC 101409]